MSFHQVCKPSPIFMLKFHNFTLAHPLLDVISTLFQQILKLANILYAELKIFLKAMSLFDLMVVSIFGI